VLNGSGRFEVIRGVSARRDQRKSHNGRLWKSPALTASQLAKLLYRGVPILI
jgi:hypothetical protein